MIYPKMTESRMRLSLDGIWDFSLLSDEESQNLQAGKHIENALSMPVPSAYNDLYETRAFRDHMGDMVYQRTVHLTKQMLQERTMLYFESVTHRAAVYWNRTLLGTHKGGFLPFEFELNGTAVPGENLLTVVVNNVLDETTLPCGRIETREYPNLPPRTVNLPNFDYFNYSGILRPVCIYTTPKKYIRDITVSGHADGSFAWDIACDETPDVCIAVRDGEGNTVFKGTGRTGTAVLNGAKLWSPEHPHLYTLEVHAGDDVYSQTFGFRDIEIRGCRILLNGEPVYLKGFGKHEDAPVSGRGYNPAYYVKDIALMKWIGANSLRTSHYPYSETFLDLCDREGILVIDEAPAVGLHTGFTAVGLLGGTPNGTWKKLKTAEHHSEVLRDMVSRDKNHPCVIAWSVANEPASEEEGAREYFEPLMNQVRRQDPQHRPVTIVTYEGSSPKACKVAELCDFLVLNRYRGWYDTEGDLEAAGELLRTELEAFHRRCPDAPIMLGEYGADAIAGMHNTTPSLFSEEYQAQMLEKYGEIMDSLPFAAGEHAWNFADFATAENIKRVQGNKKGVFTRDRQPKLAAYVLRRRWKEKK